MELVELRATQRTETGKGPAGRLRAADRIPGVLYGEKLTTKTVSVDRRELQSVLAAEGGATAIVKLMIDDDDSQTAMIKEVQRDPVRDGLLHVDFLKIAMDEKIATHVSLSVIGDALGVREGGILQQVMRDIEVEALPMELPEHIEVDVTEYQVGDSVRVGDLTAPAGVTILSGAEEVVLSIVPPTKIEEVVPVEEVLEEEEAAEEGAEEAAAAEGAAAAEEETAGE